ncbi:hypothetical protein B0H99_11010 [Planomicrobium soli]|uniref:DNA-directed RNA polymerase specialized sigma24 family protein n=1 Tax=Planomicrobium soli TaxID=1176648 RepID=A0A2P8GFZ9_9BACL|nr:hypothetical protein [Planomicrobium soli]PSL32901.1 hypothetical protein B0H99_11010 [Planomicrobium soli]
MKLEELFICAMSGEKTAYAEWCSLRHKSIARLGYQNGVAAMQLQEFQLHVFRRFYSMLPAVFSQEQEAETALYRIALKELHNDTGSKEGIANDNVLRFEEDKEIHQGIQGLNENLRISLTLYYFHGKSVKELALLLETTELAAVAAVEEASAELQKNLHLQSRTLLAKRLEFLGNSHNRFMPSFNEAELFAIHELQEELVELETAEPKTPIKKGSLTIIGLTTIFLIGVVGASFVINENESETAAAVSEVGPIDDRTVKAWKSEYESIKKSSPEKLGLDPEVYEELDYVQRADGKMERLLKKRTIKKYENDPQLLRKRIKKVMLEIQTPKGMYESLVNEGMTASESNEFLQSFALKTKELMLLADATLLKHNDSLSGTFQSGEFSAESLRAHKNQYPEEVGVLIDSLDESMLLIAPHPKGTRLLARRNMELLYSNQMLFQNMVGYQYQFQYLTLLESEPYFDGLDLLLPVDVISFQLAQFERFLLETEQSQDETYGEFEFIFQHAFWLLLTGNEKNSVFDANGVVREEYQTAWKNLVMGTANPLIYVMLPIIQEMEESSWKKSAHYDALAYSDIINALQMEKKGELAAKLPNGNISIEPAFVDMQDFSYGQTEKLYKEFAATYDLDSLKGVPPLDVLFMYHYANKRKDPETMWHLLAEDEFKPSMEVFVKQWKPLPDIEEEALWVEIYEESIYRVKDELFVEPQINYRKQDAMVPPSPVLITKRDNIWLIRNQMYEAYSLEEKTGDFKGRITALYEEFSAGQKMPVLESATPGEIAGIFLIAAEQEDVESMYSLMEESSKTISIESYRHQVANRYIPDFSTLKELAFTLDMHDYGDSQKRGWVRLNNGSDSEHSYQVAEFPMLETPEGWRIGDINMH